MTLTLQREQKRGGVAFAVTDNGPGIAPDVRPHVFRPFFTTREAGRHLGLGLTRAQQIAFKHGGALTLTNGDRGIGTIATLSLPGRRVVRRQRPRGMGKNHAVQ